MNFLKVIGLQDDKAFKVLLKKNKKGEAYYNEPGLQSKLALQPTGLSTRVVWRDADIIAPYFYSNVSWIIYSVTLRNKHVEDMSELAQTLDLWLWEYGLQTEESNLKSLKILGKKFYSTQRIIGYFCKQLAFNK